MSSESFAPHTKYVATNDAKRTPGSAACAVQFNPIPHVNQTCCALSRQERFGTPRQPNVTENTLGNKMQPASIHLNEGCRFELGLRGLSEFEYCWVVSFFHLNQGFNPLVTPPRGPRKKQGVFATRSPHRPNSIGLSCIRITSVDEKKGIIHLLGVDLLDGTAVLDIKPCTLREWRIVWICAMMQLSTYFSEITDLFTYDAYLYSKHQYHARA